MLFSQWILKYKSTGAILRQILIKNHEDDVVGGGLGGVGGEIVDEIKTHYIQVWNYQKMN